MASKLMAVILLVQLSLLEDVISQGSTVLKIPIEKTSTSIKTQEPLLQQTSQEESTTYTISNSKDVENDQPVLRVVNQKLTFQKQDSLLKTTTEKEKEIEQKEEEEDNEEEEDDEDLSENFSSSEQIRQASDQQSDPSSPGPQEIPKNEEKHEQLPPKRTSKIESSPVQKQNPPETARKQDETTSKIESSPIKKQTSQETVKKEDESNVKKPAQNTPQKQPKSVYPYRQTIFGSQCPFPFQHGGQVYTNCLVGGDDKEYCKVDGVLYQCQPRPEHEEEEQQKKKQEPRKPPRPNSVEVRFTISGKRCRLPLLVKNEYMTDCLFISSTQEICQAAGKWELCQPKVNPTPTSNNTAESEFVPAVTRTTKQGQICEFPVFFDGKNHMDCVRMPDQREWCQVDGKWQECVAAVGNMQSDMLRMQVTDNPINYQYMEEYDSVKTQSKGGNSIVPVVILGVFAAVVAAGVIGMIYGLVKMRGQYSSLMESLPRNAPNK